MNIYDTANKLAQELKNSPEYLTYKKAKEEVNYTIELKEKLEQFEKSRYEIQLASIQGNEQGKEKTIEMQQLYLDLIQNESMKQYFDAELKFNIILADVNKIIGEAVQDVLK